MGKRKEITDKDNGKQKMWIMITVIIVFFAMAGYAGMSYYYSDRFFRGTTINGINCSGKTSEEAEQAVAKKAEDYLLEVFPNIWMNKNHINGFGDFGKSKIIQPRKI